MDFERLLLEVQQSLGPNFRLPIDAFQGNQSRILPGNPNAPRDISRAETAAPRVTVRKAARSSSQTPGAPASGEQAPVTPPQATDAASAAGAASEPAAASSTTSTAATSASTAPAQPSPTATTQPATQPAAQPSTQEPTFTETDPNSPYYRHTTLTTAQMLEHFDSAMLRELSMMQHLWTTGLVRWPAAPQTAEAAAELQAQIDQLLDEGRIYEARPWQFQIAMYCFCVLGAEHPDTVQAVHALIISMHHKGEQQFQMLEWGLPRMCKQWGLGHPDTRKLACWGVEWLCECSDMRFLTPAYVRQVTNVVKALPGGLGWGAAVVAPVPDEEAFNKMVVLQARASGLFDRQGDANLAKQMFERCAKFYATLGPHWLATPRRVACQQLAAVCVRELESVAAAAPLFLENKRLAKREIGRGHKYTLQNTWLYAESLLLLKQTEKAVGIFLKNMKTYKDMHGPYNHAAFDSTVSVAKGLSAANRNQEALNMARENYHTALRALGPISMRYSVSMALEMYTELLVKVGKRSEAVGLVREAAKLGIDVSQCVV